jgi:hypothetical protein
MLVLNHVIGNILYLVLVIKYCYFFDSGFVLSSTNLNLDNCLYARNTINAIIKKSIIFEIKSPTMNFDFPMVNDTAFRFPDGMNSPIKGVMISLTNAVTILEAAWPITNAIANPIIPNVLRKSKNSCAKVLFTSAGKSAIQEVYAFPCKI